MLALRPCLCHIFSHSVESYVINTFFNIGHIGGETSSREPISLLTTHHETVANSITIVMDIEMDIQMYGL